MASFNTTDYGGSEKVDEFSSMSQITLSNQTDYSKEDSGTEQHIMADNADNSHLQQDYSFQSGNQAWVNINARLKQHGFRPVKPTSSSDMIGNSMSGIFFDEAEEHMLKNTIEKLLDDNERRQALVQELITSSNKLQEEVNEKTDKAYRFDREVIRFRKEMKIQQTKIQELEQKRLNELRSHGEEIQELSISKADIQGKYDILDQKCSEMEKEILELRYQNQELKNQELITMNQERMKEAIRNNIGTKEDTDSKNSEESTNNHVHSTPSNTTMDTLKGDQVIAKNITPDIQTLDRQLKTTEKHVEESKKLIRLLEEENNQLKGDLTKRPGLDEWRKAWKYNKKLEKILIDNNLSLSTKRGKDGELFDRREKKHKTQVKDIDYLPIDICRKHIKRICLRLNVNDLKDIIPVLESLVQLGETQKKMETLIRKILEIIDIKNIPQTLLDDISDSTEPRDHSVYCEKAWKLILPTLRKWSLEFKIIPEIKEVVIRLSQNFYPWKPCVDLFSSNKDEQLMMEDIKNALEKIMSFEDKTCSHIEDDDPTTIKQLRSIVDHFQKLFDVKNIAGIFPKMNEIYSKVGETHNVMKTIRETLSLNANANSGEIVSAICKIQTAKHYLNIDDLPGIIKRLEEYDEFFPAFQSLVSQLYDLLGVDKIDEILTAVRALIKFPSK